MKDFEPSSRPLNHSEHLAALNTNEDTDSQDASPVASHTRLSDKEAWKLHRKIALYNKDRLKPKTPGATWERDLMKDLQMRLYEGHVLEWEIAQIKEQADQAPTSPEEFMNWFEELKVTGPGQNDPLFDWLENKASQEQMTWFILQELAGEAGFDDLAALTQLKLPTQPKMEVAQNYWDEMGRGKVKAMHGPMLTRLAEELGVVEKAKDQANIVIESLALGNGLLGFAVNRRYSYHSIGALGAVELTAPGRAEKVYKGLERLNISKEGQRYFRLHSVVDIKHSENWNREVIAPLVKDNPQVIPSIAQGALVRLNAGARCFERYKKELGLDL